MHFSYQVEHSRVLSKKPCLSRKLSTGLMQAARPLRPPDFAGTGPSSGYCCALWEDYNHEASSHWGGCICALASLWGAAAIIGMWFIVPHDHSVTVAHDIRIRLRYTALFAGRRWCSALARCGRSERRIPYTRSSKQAAATKFPDKQDSR